MKVFLVSCFLFGIFNVAFSQTSSNNYPGGARNWSALTWTGGTPPTTNNGTYTENLTLATIGTGDNLTINISLTLNGNLTISSSGTNPTVTIPAGVTVVINGNLTDNDNNIAFVVNGTLIVTGTFTGKNNAVFSGSGTISGGTLNLGNGASCSGGCPTLTFATCTQGDAFCTTNVGTGTSYVWNGSASSNWQTSTNWTPTRSSPATTDFLTFPGSGANTAISNVPTQTIGNILVTGNSSYSFTPASNSLILTLSKTAGSAFQIDNPSTLSTGVSAGNSLNISLTGGGEASIGGQLNLLNGNFDVSACTLILHTNSAPLARTSGQVSANSGTIIKFGDTGYTSGSNITLPNSIFVSAPIINSLIVNSTNGATLADQSITVTSAATFTLGDLTTNAAGKIKFSSTASSPVESSSSKIIGYADMNLRTIGTGALNFLGLNIASGTDNLGSMTFTRRTGSSGINTFNANQSIASTWDITSAAEPTSGRNISFSWQSAFDNVSTASKKFQVYIFNSGPGWTTVGALQALASVGPPRQSVAVSTTKLTDTFTLTDETQTLPIELISFSARANATSVTLNWKTATEKNNDYFLVERMISVNDFQPIAKVIGAGNTLLESNYSLVDEKPVQGVNYYRLKQVDFDGKFTYSDVIKVEFTGKINTDVTIYPNPADKVLNFDNLDADTWVSLTDSQGKVIFTTLVKSDNASLELNEYHLTSGLYFVHLLDAKKSQVKKIVIK